jgi:glycogen synthase
MGASPAGRMSVLALTNMYPPHHLGGYELSCWDVLQRWRGAGHRTSVLTTTMRVPGVEQPDGADVDRSLQFYWDDHRLVTPPPWRRWRMERSNQAALAEALDRVSPDVVSVWNVGAMSLGLLTTVAERRIPMVLVICDDWPVYAPDMDAWSRMFHDRPRLARVLRRLGGPAPGPPDLDAVGPACFVSEFTRERARAWTRWRFPCSDVVYSGIDLADFPLAVATDGAAPGSGPWAWRLLYVGRLDPRKGIETLLRAMPLLPQEATLSVVGRGPEDYAGRLRDLAAELGISSRVRFGSGDRAQLRRFYDEADLFVFPSEWDEPFGLVPVEAMACAVPVVATGTGGSAEFLSHEGNCVLYEAGDAGSLAAAATRLALDGDLRLRLVEGGLRTATELSVDRLAEVLEAWHRAAVDDFRDGRPPSRPVPSG